MITPAVVATPAVEEGTAALVEVRVALEATPTVEVVIVVLIAFMVV